MASSLPMMPTRPNVLVVHQRLTINDFTREDPKEWDVDMLENFVVLEDIPLICSLAISQTTYRDIYY